MNLNLERTPSGSAYVAAKESLQRATHPENIKEPEMLLEWRDEINAECEAKGLSAETPGAFYLASMDMNPATEGRVSLFWGADYEAGTLPPWKEAMDFIASETWEARLKRKIDEWGETPELNFVIGQSPNGAWLVALKNSIFQCDPGAVHAVPSFDAAKKWRDAFEDFSRIMDLPLKKPRWMLGLTKFSDAEESKVSE